MINARKYGLFIIAAFFGLCWLACTQDRQPCLTPKIASFNMEFMHYYSDTTPPVDTVLPAAIFTPIAPDTIDRQLVYPPQSNFTISLSSVTDSCRWAFTTDTLGTLFDTFTLYYKRQLQFLSNACGYAYFYNLDSVHTTYENIDSVVIVNRSVTNNVNTKHLQVYIHRNY